MTDAPRWRRILLKLSGEALMGPREFGLDVATLDEIAGEVAGLARSGVEVALVIGGGNVFRGLKAAAGGMDRVTGDHMGMLATVMNALAMADALERQGVGARVQSAIPMAPICEPYDRARAREHLKAGRVVIFAAGTGNPYFTTDTGAALRAVEMGCEAVLKATQVDGVYSADPKTDPSATRFDRLGYLDVLSRDLRVMDATAISLARENAMPIVVFSIHDEGALASVVAGGGRCTVIS